MLPSSHPLIEAATKPLADNAEQRLSANALLEETFVAADPDIPENIARLERADGKRFPRLWRVCLHVCAAVAFLLLAFPSEEVRQIVPDYGELRGFGGGTPSMLPENLTPAQRLLVGDPALPRLRQKELLHLSAPERADFYTEYAGVHASEYDKLPDGFLETTAHIDPRRKYPVELRPDGYLETTARIDPDNAFHLYNAAAREGEDSFEKVKPANERPTRYSAGKRIREVPDETIWKINDEVKFNEALDLIAKAASLSRYDTYETSLVASRLPLFNQDRLVPRIRTLAYFAGQTTQVISLRKTADLISAQAYFLSLSGDTEDFLKLYADSEAFLAHLARAPDSHLVGELVYAVSASTTANAFHFGADRLSLPELAENMQLRRHAFIDDANMRQLREDSMSDRFQKEASTLALLIAPMVSKQVANPPPFDPESLTPGRLSEHDLFSSVLLPALAVLLGLAALATFVSRSLLPRPVKLVSKRLDLLLRPCDWVWVAGAVVVPIALTLLITRYTPLGGRDFSIRHNQMLFPTAHHLLILFLLLTIPPAVIRWRLGKRLGVFGMESAFRPVLFILPAVGTLALFVAHPVIERFSIERESPAMLGFVLIVAAWGVFILSGYVRMYFGKRKEHRISWATVFGILPTALSFSIILLAVLVPVYRESADRWIARDDLTRTVVYGFNFQEAEIARQKRKETNAILGFE